MTSEKFILQLRQFIADGQPVALLAFVEHAYDDVDGHLTPKERRVIGELVNWAERVQELEAWEQRGTQARESEAGTPQETPQPMEDNRSREGVASLTRTLNFFS
jgi:hypothetical protein